MNKDTCWIGIDIGGTNTEVGFVDSSGKFLEYLNFQTKAKASVQLFIKKLRHALDAYISRINETYKVGGVGIAAPNVNYVTGLIESPVNFQWGNIDLVSLLSQYYNVPIRIIKDSYAAALGEMTHGLAKNMKNFVVITIGTGLGSGIVINRELITGAHGLAGEIGHTAAIQYGRHCVCGREGCLEAYVSASGICRTAIEIMNDYSHTSALNSVNPNKLTVKMISEAAASGDDLALHTLDFTAQVLGKKLADIATILNPETFIIAGGVANMGDLLLTPTREYFENQLMPMYKGKIKIIRSNMSNGQAAILGAASLVYEMNKN